MLLVSRVTMVNAVNQFPPLLSSWHGCPLMPCGLVERLGIWGIPLYNTCSLDVNRKRLYTVLKSVHFFCLLLSTEDGMCFA